MSTAAPRGFRTWRVQERDEEYVLTSTHFPDVWLPAVWKPRQLVRVSCSCPRPPSFRHTCGIYAFELREDAETYLRTVARERRAWSSRPSLDPLVIGSVAYGGRVVKHARGVRAECAYPLELMGIVVGEGEPWEGIDHSAVVDVLAWKYGIAATLDFWRIVGGVGEPESSL